MNFIDLLYDRGLNHVAEKILCYLDFNSLCYTELVSKNWKSAILYDLIWKKMVEQHVRCDSLWEAIVKERSWIRYLFKPALEEHRQTNMFYKKMFRKLMYESQAAFVNWTNGVCNLQRIECRTEAEGAVYSLQYDEDKIVTGHSDYSVKIWDRSISECIQVLTGHEGPVYCIQFDDRVILSGSDDSTVRVWHVKNGRCVNTLTYHTSGVMSIRFHHGMLITGSKDFVVGVWDMISPTQIHLRHALTGHLAGITVVDFDHWFIVSSSCDRTVRVWLTSTLAYHATLVGHKRGIACMQYKNNLCITGGADHDIRLWDVLHAHCLRVLTGHQSLVKSLYFAKQKLISGDCDGELKVWNLEWAVLPYVPVESVCRLSFKAHVNRVYAIQFDDLVLMSCSQDDRIIIQKFLM